MAAELDDNLLLGKREALQAKAREVEMRQLGSMFDYMATEHFTPAMIFGSALNSVRTTFFEHVRRTGSLNPFKMLDEMHEQVQSFIGPDGDAVDRKAQPGQDAMDAEMQALIAEAEEVEKDDDTEVA